MSVRRFCDVCETEFDGDGRVGSWGTTPCVKVVTAPRWTSLAQTAPDEFKVQPMPFWDSGDFCPRCTVRAVIQAAGLGDVFVEKEEKP